MADDRIDTSDYYLDVIEKLPLGEQATTSRVLFSNELIRQVVFSFDTGQKLTEHASPKAVVVLLVQGRMSFTLEGKQFEMKAGDTVYLAPGSPHALEALEPCYMALTMVNPPATPVHDDKTQG